jgi:hypothetical protein
MRAKRDIVASHIEARERVRMLEITPRDSVLIAQEPWTPEDRRAYLLAELMMGLSVWESVSGQNIDAEYLTISGPARIIREAMWDNDRWDVLPDHSDYEALSLQPALSGGLGKQLAYEFSRLLMVVGAYPSQTAQLGATGKDPFLFRAADDGVLRTVFGGTTGDGYQGAPRATNRVVEWDCFGPLGEMATYSTEGRSLELFPWEDFRSPGTGWPTYGHLGDAPRWTHVGGDPANKNTDTVNSWAVQRTKEVSIYEERHFAGIITAVYIVDPSAEIPDYEACYSVQPDLQPDVADFVLSPGTWPERYTARYVDSNAPCPNNEYDGEIHAGGVLYEARGYAMDELFFKKPPRPFMGESNYNRIRNDFSGVQPAPREGTQDEEYVLRAIVTRLQFALDGNAKIGESFTFPLVTWFIDNWMAWLDNHLRLSAQHGGWEPCRVGKNLRGRVDARVTNGVLHLRGYVEHPNGRPTNANTYITDNTPIVLPSSINPYSASFTTPWDSFITFWADGVPAECQIENTDIWAQPYDWRVIRVLNRGQPTTSNRLLFDGVAMPVGPS